MREVPSQEWNRFCQRLNQFEGGATVTLEVVEQSGAKKEIARDAIFDRMDFGRRDGCNDQISIRSRGNGETTHAITEPIHILLNETEGGAAFQSVVIQAEEGITTVKFQPVIRAAWLEGVRLQ
jgi:hypothetical protein